MSEEADLSDVTSIALWGKDHWSTYTYLGYLIVHANGIPQKDRMRCDPDLHPGLLGAYQARESFGSNKYPTRLKGGIEKDNHDDWSCIEDAVALGLVEWNGTGMHPIFAFTPKGWELHAKLEKHIAAKKPVEQFNPGAIE